MAQAENRYYIPHGSHWPIIGSIGLFVLMFGVSTWLNGADYGFWVMLAGAAVIIWMLAGWFSTVIAESIAGKHNRKVDTSFRMGMFWFIFSEVMFFSAFFGALFYARNVSIPWLGGSSNNFFTNLLLWNEFESTWPTAGPGGAVEYEVMAPFGLPLINTAILLTSSATVTIAHHALLQNRRLMLNVFLALTFALGYTFVYLQAVEYVHAYQEMNLRLTTGIYGTTFFMLTGFHGLHVTVGAIMLSIMWLRTMKGHFTPESHFGFEAAAWYWHFVDAVWIGLYVFVYWM
jgi:cytochrome c oxidase subunit III